MKGLNYSNNGRSTEVILPLGLSQIFSDKLKDLFDGKDGFERVVTGLAIFSLQTENSCLLLRDFSRIVFVHKEEVSHVLSSVLPVHKERVLSIFSAICSDNSMIDVFEIGCDEQQLYLDPGMPDHLYSRFAHRLASHVLEFQLEDEWKVLESIDDRELKSSSNKTSNV